jgi:hypothetical protein
MIVQARFEAIEFEGIEARDWEVDGGLDVWAEHGLRLKRR